VVQIWPSRNCNWHCTSQHVSKTAFKHDINLQITSHKFIHNSPNMFTATHTRTVFSIVLDGKEP
jgi:hypothetical protein